MWSRFDQLAKRMTRTGFAPGGPVHTDHEVSPDARRIDVWFTPVAPGVEELLRPLGLLGRMGFTACTLEAFHRTPGGVEVMDCVCKHHLFRGQLARRQPMTPLPVQWIVSSGRPESALSGLRFEPSMEWGAGIHEGPPLTITRLVVVSDLPATRDTLLVRLLGAGAVFQRAITEVSALPDEAPERALSFPLLLELGLQVKAQPAPRTPEDEEFLMATQDLVHSYLEEQRRAARHEGRNQGQREGERQALVTVLRARFGELPPDLAAIVDRTDDLALLNRWLQLAAVAPQEELFSAIRSSTAP